MVKRIFSTPTAKITVDILLVAGLFLSLAFSRFEGSASWGSLHCIVSMAWYALMLVHIGQHWRLTKALPKPKVMKRNKITFLTLIVFILLTFSIILFVADINDKFVHIHHGVASLFSKVIIIHAIMKAKRFVQLFQNNHQKKIIMKNRLKKIHTGYVWANTRNCKACWECISTCPNQVIGKVDFLWHKHIVFKKSENCTGCKKCIKLCPHGVFSENIPDVLKKYSNFVKK